MNTSRRMKDGTPIMDIDYTTSVSTPHVPWAIPYHKGPLKAFFLPSVKGGRDFAELMQRLDVEAVAVTHDRAWDLDKWGFGDFYDRRVRIWEYQTVYAYLVDALASDAWYDVMIMQGVNGWGFLPKEARQAVLRRVKEGAGLVLVHPFHGGKVGGPVLRAAELDELSPLVGCPNDLVDEGGYPVVVPGLLSAAWRREGRHFITENFPFDALPYEEMAYYPYKAKGEVIIAAGSGDPIAAVKEVGKGRVVAFGYYNRDIAPQHRDHQRPVGGLSSNADFWQGGFSKCAWNSNEYVYALLAKAAVWAARKEPDVAFQASVTGGALEVSLGGKPSGAFEVEAAVTNRWGAEEMRSSETVDAGRGARSARFTLPNEVLAGGLHLANVIVRSAGKAVNWGAVAFDVEVPAHIDSVAADKEVYKPKDRVKAEVVIDGRAEGLRLELALVDAFDRVVSDGYCDVAPGEPAAVELSREGVLTPQMWVRARLTSAGRLFDERKSARLTAVPDYDRNIHDVELVVAQYDRGRGDYVEAVRRQLLAFGATNGYYGSSKILAESGAEGGGVYWYHRAPYTARKEKYLRTGDKKYLERVPCLSDPEFLREVHDKIVRTAALGTKYAPLSYYVQDEGSLTCYADENDLCFAKATLAAMRRWLKAEYKDLRRLNAEWGTKFSAWDKVVPMTIDEARAHGNLAPWADHRTFMEMAFADYFKLVRDSVREADKTGRIRLSGCQISSPYTGMDYWRLHQIFEYFEAYGGGNQYEFHHSFQGPRTILGTWIGYGQRGRASNHKIWNAFFHQIRLFNVFWEFAVVNPDFTLCGSAEDMAATFRELRGSGVSEMLFDAHRDDSRIAVHYSYPSVHATFGVGKFPRFNAAREGWLHVLQDLGYQQSFVSRRQIEAGELVSRRFKVFIMPFSMALSPREAVEIRRFARAGGTVVADFQAGVMDDRCRYLEKGALDDLFGIRRFNVRHETFYINKEPMRTPHLPDLCVSAVQEASVAQEEPGIRAARGKPLFLDDFAHAVPSLVVNGFGKGRGVYLNFGADVCASAPESAQAKAVSAALGEVLALAGARPIMKVTKADGRPLDRVEAFCYRGRGVEYYCLLRENVGSSEVLGYDGIVRGGAEGQSGVEKISVALPARGHVYDCLAKNYLGSGGRFEAEILPAQAKVFAVYPYEIEDMRVRMEALANVVDYSFEVVASDGKPREHTVVLEVMNSAGHKNPLYSKNIRARNGKADGRIRFSLEGETGAWTLRFTEAASGITKSVEVLVP